MAHDESWQRTLQFMAILISAIVLVFVLKTLKNIFVPMVLAVFISASMFTSGVLAQCPECHKMLSLHKTGETRGERIREVEYQCGVCGNSVWKKRLPFLN